MSSRKSDTLSKETELNNGLDEISQDENSCISELKNDIIKLLNEEQGKNKTSINECENKINEILNTLLGCMTRTDVLIRRKDTCLQYMEDIS